MNKKAYYGQFGGQYVAESLMNTLQELDQAYEEAIHDPEFMKQYPVSYTHLTLPTNSLV